MVFGRGGVDGGQGQSEASGGCDRGGECCAGVVKLLGVEGDVACESRAAGCFRPWSGSRGQADDLVPGGEAGGHFVSVGIRGEAVAAGPEVR